MGDDMENRRRWVLVEIVGPKQAERVLEKVML